MRHPVIWLAVLGLLAGAPAAAEAAACASGPNHAGCVGPNGTVVATTKPAVVAHPGMVRCADGAYRTACVTANGAVVAPKPLAKPPVHCSAGVYRAGCVGVPGPRISRR
jgi:hypothetical protein